MWVRSYITVTSLFELNRLKSNATVSPGIGLGSPPLLVGGTCRTWELPDSACVITTTTPEPVKFRGVWEGGLAVCVLRAQRAGMRLFPSVGPLVNGDGVLPAKTLIDMIR